VREYCETLHLSLLVEGAENFSYLKGSQALHALASEEGKAVGSEGLS
jgi:hypothetical protein